MARRRVVLEKTEPLHDDRAFFGYATGIMSAFKVERSGHYLLAIMGECARQPFEVDYGEDKAARDKMFAQIIDESRDPE